MSKKKKLTVWEKGVLLEEIKHLDTIDKIENFIKRNWELLYDSMEEENAQLKQQLAEKDKKIEQLKEECNKLSDREFEHFGDMKTYKNMWLKEQKQSVKLRHEICEKIREKLDQKLKYNFTFNPAMVEFITLNIEDIREFLDQIEKGEE